MSAFRWIGAVSVLALLVTPALAYGQTACQGGAFDGVNQLSISWDDCWYLGSVATTFKTLNCNARPTQNITVRLHFQFRTPVVITSTIAAVAVLRFETGSSDPLPPFFRYEPEGCAGSGSTKGIATSVYPAPVSCATNGKMDYSGYCGETVDETSVNECASWGFIYAPDTPCGGMARVILFAERSFGRAIETDMHSWLGALEFTNRLRGTCSGCGGLNIFWESLALVTDDGQGTLCLTGPDSPKGPDRAGLGNQNYDWIQHPGCTVSTRSSSWGQIKALFR